MMIAVEREERRIRYYTAGIVSRRSESTKFGYQNHPEYIKAIFEGTPEYIKR